MSEGSIQKSVNEMRKENYENAKKYIESKNWDEYIYDLEKRRDFLKNSIAISDEVKLNHPKEIDKFNNEILPVVEYIKSFILELSKINNSVINSLREDFESLRTRLGNLSLDEAVRGKYKEDMIKKYGFYERESVAENSEAGLEEAEVVEGATTREELIEEIKEKVSRYRNEYIEIIEPLLRIKNKYLSESDPRIKELNGDEFDREKENCMSLKKLLEKIDNYSNEVIEKDLFYNDEISERMQIIYDLRKEVASFSKDSIEKADEVKAA